jgi:hypothetical protein
MNEVNDPSFTPQPAQKSFNINVLVFCIFFQFRPEGTLENVLQFIMPLKAIYTDCSGLDYAGKTSVSPTHNFNNFGFKNYFCIIYHNCLPLNSLVLPFSPFCSNYYCLIHLALFLT